VAGAGAPPLPPAADPRLYAPPAAREAATAFACTAETLVSGADCILESDAPLSADPAAQLRDNAALAAAMATWACAAAAREPSQPAPDPDVKARCEKAFRERALGCGADGARALLDVRGRFAPEARLCYSALGEALAQARSMASMSAPCCRCLAAARCAELGRCHRELLSGSPDGRTAACLRASCAEECRSFLPDRPPAALQPSGAAPPPPPPPPPPP
jgi:hypothetical protein